jgi:hypothetical protein
VDAFKPIARHIAICLGLFLLAAPVLAQTSDSSSLTLLTPVEGRVDADAEQTWTFDAVNGQMLSFYVKDLSGGFDPILRINDSSGEALVGNDDYNYPSNGDALLEGITIPRTGSYSVTVSGFNGQAGVYRLTMLPGFAEIQSNENFNGNLTWNRLAEPVVVNAADGMLALALEGMRLRGIAVSAKPDAPATYYAQASIEVSGGQDGWVVGMATRLQADDQYYVLNVNSQGLWRFLLHQADGDHIIRDWTPHPAIVPDKSEFSLGILAHGVGYDFFYDGQLFGRLSDSSLPADGDFGLAVDTQGSPTSQTTALFDDLVITIPTLINNEPLIPSQVVIGKPNEMVQELQRRNLIPGGGEMALTVNESFVESRRPGIERLMLGRGETYQNFAVGTTVGWQASSAGMSGCGIILRAADETHYTLAYLDQTGGYGLSPRDGDSFEPGIFGMTPEFSTGNHHLLVIARRNNLYYYVDGQYKGILENRVVNGAVGDAVVNFEPISTSCTFTETWLWRWNEN